jgi:hypothetical protein
LVRRINFVGFRACRSTVMRRPYPSVCRLRNVSIVAADTAYSCSQFITTSMWFESIFAPLRAIAPMTSEKCLPSIKQYVLLIAICLPAAKSTSLRPFSFELTCRLCLLLSLAYVGFPGQFLHSRHPSPTSRHDLGMLRMPAPAVHKIDSWPPLLIHLMVHVMFMRE